MKDIPANKIEIFYLLALCEVDGIGVVSTKKLINHFGSAREVFKQKTNDLLQIPGMTSARANAISKYREWEKVSREIEFAEKNNHRILSYLHTDYPNRLKHCDDGPPVLFVKGQADLSGGRMLSIVGTRRLTEYGKSITKQVVKDLVPYGVTVVSGLAYGVDIEAHKACLQFDVPTIAVLGHGLDKVYPSSHTQVAKAMVEKGGALVSEFPTNTKPDRENFPMRNRIVAGMCDATLVIESAKRGGSIITAELANDYNRDVFAVPGKLGDERSEGCNRLIKSHRAALFESVKDFEYIMGWTVTDINRSIQKKIFVELNSEEERLLNTLKTRGRLQIDELSLELDSPMSNVMVNLLNLELNGMIRCLPGKFYEIC